MKHQYSLERIYGSTYRLEEILKTVTPVFSVEGKKPMWIEQLELVKRILDDVYQKEL